MATRMKTRNRVTPAGVLSPQNWYTRRGLRDAMGIGHHLITIMRSQGVRAIQVGNTRWFCGADIIAWVEAQPSKED